MGLFKTLLGSVAEKAISQVKDALSDAMSEHAPKNTARPAAPATPRPEPEIVERTDAEWLAFFREILQTQFAAIFEVTPAEVSRLIKKDSFDAQKLLKISRLLNYNFFQDFYQYSSHTENRSIDGWASIMKRNEELVAENARLRDYLKDVYSKMQKFKEDNGVSIENWDSLVKKEGVDVMNMASFFFLDANIKKFLDESDQTDSSKKTDKD